MQILTFFFAKYKVRLILRRLWRCNTQNRKKTTTSTKKLSFSYHVNEFLIEIFYLNKNSSFFQLQFAVI